MKSAYFDMGSAALCVEGPSSAVQLMEWLFSPRQLSERPAIGKVLKIEMRKSRPESAVDEQIDEKKTLTGHTLRLYRAPGRTLVAGIGDQLMADFYPDGIAIISGVVDDDSKQKGLDDLMLMAMDHVTTYSGQTFMHAACLASPDNASCILLHAKSGTGKTTTSFALTTQGYRILGDDSAVVTCAEGAKHATAWGVPRAPKVHFNTVDKLPFLRANYESQTKDIKGERFLDRKALIEDNIIINARDLPISAIVSLARDPSRPAEIVRASAFEGLSDLLSDNLSTAGAALMPHDERKLDTYSALVKCTPAYRVNLNGEPVEMARLTARELGYQSGWSDQLGQPEKMSPRA